MYNLHPDYTGEQTKLQVSLFTGKTTYVLKSHVFFNDS